MTLTCVTATFNVIAAGNRERLIRCVESVTAIPVEHEHLIYDGASTDGTVELLRELEAKTPGLKVVSEKDTGLYNALNKGVRDAQGNWFHVLGCDDFVSEPATMALAIEKGEAERAEMVGSPVAFPRTSDRRERWGMRFCLCGLAYPHPGTLMRTDLVRRLNGFDENYRIVADLDLLQRAVLSSVGYAVIDRPFVTFALDGMSSNEGRVAEEHRRVLQKHFGLSDAERIGSYPKRVLPLRVVMRYLFGRRGDLRQAAIYQLGRLLLNACGRIDEKGRTHV